MTATSAWLIGAAPDAASLSPAGRSVVLSGKIGPVRVPGERVEQRTRLRDEQPPVAATVLIRGGPDTVGKLRRHAERTARAWALDIVADLNDEDETGYVWTFLDEARDPGQIKPGAIIVAGDEDTAAVCEVIDLAPAGDGTIVHLRLLPGLVEDNRALVERALAS